MYIEIVGAHIEVTQPNLWLNRIEQEGHESHDVSALALIPFYYEYAAAGKDGSWVQLDVTRSLHRCSELDFGPISIDIMQSTYNRHWKGVTFHPRIEGMLSGVTQTPSVVRHCKVNIYI